MFWHEMSRKCHKYFNTTNLIQIDPAHEYVDGGVLQKGGLRLNPCSLEHGLQTKPLVFHPYTHLFNSFADPVEPNLSRYKPGSTVQMYCVVEERSDYVGGLSLFIEN